jgi:cGMP-dependent protein kinase
MFSKKLGEGQFGQVFLVKHNNSNSSFALKCIKKKTVNKLKLQCLVNNEKEIMESIDYPFIVRLE